MSIWPLGDVLSQVRGILVISQCALTNGNEATNGRKHRIGLRYVKQKNKVHRIYSVIYNAVYIRVLNLNLGTGVSQEADDSSPDFYTD